MSIHSAKPVRGTRDILPEEMALRNRAEQIISDTYRNAGFEQIETPVLEDIDLLLGSEGGENLKMLFTVLKRGDKFRPAGDSQPRDLCDTGLRFDLTLPLSRYFSNNKEKLPLPFKAVQIGNVFRAERPQKGRFRSFKQCDIDIIGDPSIGAEIELIHTTGEALKALGFKDFTIKINDRKLLNAFLESRGFTGAQIPSVCIVLDKMDKIGPEGVAAELTEKFADLSQQDASALVTEAASMTLDNVAQATGLPDAVADLKLLVETANASSGGDYQAVFDFSLIRGMGYYTGPVFEVSYGPYGYSVGGGGRYDEMIGKTSKQSVPAVGFSIGFERIIGILEDEGRRISDEEKSIVLFYSLSDDMPAVLKTADSLKADGYRVIMTQQKKKFGKQLQHAQETGASGFMVFGRDEKPRLFGEED
ncbi:MAG: histidine--tRNA ligase [Eubacteriaceae bacterium]|jgi:histidyl-tRNA synthetase